MWWFRIALFVVIVVITTLAVIGALNDGARGLSVLPWIVGIMGIIAWAVFPSSKPPTSPDA